uniref:GTD-binding domain-containing protein n=1 Tax=Oryza glumipatula TaxID=40148 RepID=A0A0D9Z2H1_9ORYZ
MAAKARARSPDFARQFWPVLCHAFSECSLIIMLFVTAVVSFTATRFARIWSLRPPCILCSRLDRLLHGNTWFSEDLICAAHKLEISQLEYCQSHNKLAHSDDLCERCLLSCAGLDETFKKTRHAHKLPELANGIVPDDVSTVKERSIDMTSVGHSSDEGSEELSYGGYSKLNVRHDSESENRISDDDEDEDGNSMIHKATQRSRDFLFHDSQLQPMISDTNSLSMHPSENVVLAEPMNTAPVPVSTAAKTDNVATGTNLVSAAKSSEHIAQGSREISLSNVNVSGNNHDVQPKIVPEQVCAELPKEKTFLVGIEEIGDSVGISGSPDEEVAKGFVASANAGMSSVLDACINRKNSMKSASRRRSNLQSPRWSEIISAKDNSSRTNQEVKTFLSQMSSARGFDGPWSEVAASPRITQIDDKQYDATGSRQFLETNYSNMEPFDVHATSEDEGDTSLEGLKQKVELGKKKMSILYKEFEAERSASAVAASEAMAMINRLQEEKASMHMEALQYLRMMEEQADHDQEAIERLNDLLTEREKEMLDLEAELDNYRRLHEPFGCKFDFTDGDMASGVLDSSDFMRDTMFDFEDEKANILKSLSKLEETLGMSSTDRHNFGGTYDSLQNMSVLHPEHWSGEPVSSQQIDENQSVDSGSCSHLDDGRISSMTSVKHEISLLNTRFTALETDQKFLKQILSSLKCSDDGVQCVQEITAHLRELRRIMTEQRERAVL